MELVTLLDQAQFWHWWVLALALAIVEITLFGAFFLLWPALAAVVVGFMMLIMPDAGWQFQLFVWAVLSIASVIGWRFYRKAHPGRSDEPLLNQRGEQYVGRVFTLEDSIVNGQGQIRVDDSMWKIECEEDFEAGIKVKAIDVEGTILKVEKA